jgi:carbon storage regulator
MLVLTRSVGEQIQIGDKIVVTVVRLAGGAVRLGIEAPENARIVRRELAPPPAPSIDTPAADGSAANSPQIQV